MNDPKYSYGNKINNKEILNSLDKSNLYSM